MVAGSTTAASADSSLSGTGAALVTTGDLVVLADGGDDLAHEAGEIDPAPLSSTRQYAVVTESGDVIPVDGAGLEDATSGDSFTGVLTVPDDVIAELGLQPGATIDANSVQGAGVIDALGASSGPLTVQEGSVEPADVAAATTSAPHTFDVAVVDPLNAPAPLVTNVTLDGMLSDVGGYWMRETNNAISGFVRSGGITRYASAVNCATGADNSFWTEAAAKFGRTTSSYYSGSGRHLVVILPEACLASMGLGLGSVGSLQSGGLTRVVEYKDTMRPTIAHEIGHNLGLGHSNLSYCRGASAESSSCSMYSYADAYSVMGYAWVGYPALPALPAPMRDALGALPAGAQAVLPSYEAPAGGTFTLKPSTDASGLRSIRVDDPNTTVQYFLEYRTGAGADANAAYTRNPRTCQDSGCTEGWGGGNGLRVLIRDTSSGSVVTEVYTHYIDATKPKWGSPVLTQGWSFVSPSGAVLVELGAVTSASATVTVSLGDNQTYTAPPSTTTPNPSTLSPHSWDPGLYATASASTGTVHAWGTRKSAGAWGTREVNYQAGATTGTRAGSSGSLSVRLDGTHCSGSVCGYGSGTGFKGLVQLWNDPTNFIAFGLIRDPGVSPTGTTLMIEGAAGGKPVGGYWAAGALSGSSHVFDIEWSTAGITLIVDGKTKLGPYPVAATNPSISFLSAGRNTSDQSDTTFNAITFSTNR